MIEFLYISMLLRIYNNIFLGAQLEDWRYPGLHKGYFKEPLWRGVLMYLEVLHYNLGTQRYREGYLWGMSHMVGAELYDGYTT